MRQLNISTLIVIVAISCLNLLSSTVYSQESSKHSVHRPEGYVPDTDTAIKIAVAVWEPIYGKDKIDKEKPYKAILKNGVWFISGSLPKPKIPGGVVKGGVAEAEINKNDGCIIRVNHGK